MVKKPKIFVLIKDLPDIKKGTKFYWRDGLFYYGGGGNVLKSEVENNRDYFVRLHSFAFTSIRR